MNAWGAAANDVQRGFSLQQPTRRSAAGGFVRSSQSCNIVDDIAQEYTQPLLSRFTCLELCQFHICLSLRWRQRHWPDDPLVGRKPTNLTFINSFPPDLRRARRRRLSPPR